MAQSTTKRYPSHEWLVLAKFPSYADAKAFQALAEEAFGIEMSARPKGQYESAGNIATWRMTKILRSALSGNSFTLEGLQIAAQTNGFTGKSAVSWLNKAHKHGVLRRLERGTYEFIPLLANAGIVDCQPLSSLEETP